MQTVTVEINNANALKTLEALANKHFISIIDKTDFDSPALPGKPLSITQFKKWISDAENAPSVSLNEAKAIWAKRQKQLEKL